MLEETYGGGVYADTISAITYKVWPLMEACHNQPLAAILVGRVVPDLFPAQRAFASPLGLTPVTLAGIHAEGTVLQQAMGYSNRMMPLLPNLKCIPDSPNSTKVGDFCSLRYYAKDISFQAV